MPVLAIFVVLMAGVGVALQAPTNAALAKASGSVLLAALVSFVVGTIVLAIAWQAADRAPLSGLRGAPWWAWIGGLYGACFVSAMAYGAPRLGLATTLTLAVGSQLVVALVLDHFGLFGLKLAPISCGRVGGIMLVIAGIVLVRRG